MAKTLRFTISLAVGLILAQSAAAESKIVSCTDSESGAPNKINIDLDKNLIFLTGTPLPITWSSDEFLVSVIAATPDQNSAIVGTTWVLNRRTGDFEVSFLILSDSGKSVKLRSSKGHCTGQF